MILRAVRRMFASISNQPNRHSARAQDVGGKRSRSTTLFVKVRRQHPATATVLHTFGTAIVLMFLEVARRKLNEFNYTIYIALLWP